MYKKILLRSIFYLFLVMLLVEPSSSAQDADVFLRSVRHCSDDTGLIRPNTPVKINFEAFVAGVPGASIEERNAAKWREADVLGVAHRVQIVKDPQDDKDMLAFCFDAEGRVVEIDLYKPAQTIAERLVLIDPAVRCSFTRLFPLMGDFSILRNYNYSPDVLSQISTTGENITLGDILLNNGAYKKYRFWGEGHPFWGEGSHDVQTLWDEVNKIPAGLTSSPVIYPNTYVIFDKPAFPGFLGLGDVVVGVFEPATQRIAMAVLNSYASPYDLLPMMNKLDRGNELQVGVYGTESTTINFRGSVMCRLLGCPCSKIVFSCLVSKGYLGLFLSSKGEFSLYKAPDWLTTGKVAWESLQWMYYNSSLMEGSLVERTLS